MISVHRTSVEWVHANFNAAKEIDNSFEIYKVMDDEDIALVVGFLVPSLIGWADIWVIPGRITNNLLKARSGLMNLAASHYPHISAHTADPIAERFARFFGFNPVRPVEIAGQKLMRLEWHPPFQ